jgi:iron complex transport system permease protein
MAWARLGVLFAIMLFPSASLFVKMMISIAFAFGGTLLFIRLLKLIPLRDEIFIPLLGIMLGNVVGSITTFFAYRYDLIQNISGWLQGSFTMVLRGRYELLYIGVPLLILAMIFSNQFTIASMGDEFSSNLGLDYQKTVKLGLMIAAIITSVVVVTIGTIPFIGMIVPNVVRLYKGDNLKENIWDISLCGGLLVLIGDIISRLIIYPFEIPISVTIGVFGSAGFIYLLLRGNRRASA